MSLQKKIEQDMNDLALKIIRRAEKGEDVKIVLMCKAWFDLKRLLTMANSVVEIDTKLSNERLESIDGVKR